jgi:hypothetical protein
MRPAIIEKLNRHMSSAPKTEADVVYGLVEIRKLLEQSGHKERFPRLVFFCDWVVHPWLKGRETQNVLMELDQRLGRYDASRPWEIDEDGKVHELLSLRRFAEELNACCRENGIDEIWTQDIWVWREVSRLYSEIVRDCPLSMKRQDCGFDYLATLEIDGCEPSDDLRLGAWPHGGQRNLPGDSGEAEAMRETELRWFVPPGHLAACPNSQIGNGSIIVPDRKLECWKHSNPKGFAEWFLTQCQIRDALAEADWVFKGSVEPLPSPVPSEYKYPLQRIVQLMKRHRDIFFFGGRDIARSVILTTLAGGFYKGQRSLTLALESVLDGIHAALSAIPQVPSVPNPVHPEENFADTWDQTKYEQFKSYIENFRRGLKAAMHPTVLSERQGLEKSTDHLGELFGADRVRDAIRAEAAEINEGRNSGKLGVAVGGVLTGMSKAGAIPVPRNQFFGR